MDRAIPRTCRKALITAPATALALLLTPVAGIADVPDTTAASPMITMDSVVTTLEREIPTIMAEGEVVGLTIALVDGRRTVWRAGFGDANRETDTPVTTKTLFHIGSTSKTMTAMAVMQLVERGLVDLDAPFQNYVPELRMMPRYRGNVITVRDVMTHHSGIPGDLMNIAEIATEPDDDFDRVVLRSLRRQQVVRRAGTAWAYSNLGITLLQNLVANVTGQSFDRYTQRHIFRPLGMRSSSFDDSTQSGRKVSAAYQYISGQDTRARRMPREYVNIRPAGSVYSNARDMTRYLKAMIGFGATPDGTRVLGTETVKQMITPQPASPCDRMFFKQGLVWWVGYGAPWLRDVVNHGGDTYLHHTMAAWSPQHRVGVFVSVNTGTDAAPVVKTVWQRALALLLTAKTGMVPAPPDPPAPLSAPKPAEMNRMVGRYANSEGLVQLARSGESLTITIGAQDPAAQPRPLQRRTDGWYMTDDGQEALRMTRIEGKRVLLIRLADGTSGLFAERLWRDPRIPAAWRSRLGEYQATNVDPATYPTAGMSGTIPLYAHDGVLFLGNAIVRPAGRSLGYDYGVTPLQVMRDAGFSVRASGDTLRWKGLRLVRTDVTGQRSLPPPSVGRPLSALVPDVP